MYEKRLDAYDTVYLVRYACKRVKVLCLFLVRDCLVNMDRMCILTHSPSTMHHATTFSRSSAVPERPTASWGESTCTYDRWSIRPSRANRYPNAPLLLGANRLTPLVYERPETVFWSESSSRAISYRRGAPQSFSGGRIKYLKFGTIFSEPALMAIGHHPRKHQNIPRSCLLG